MLSHTVHSYFHHFYFILKLLYLPPCSNYLHKNRSYQIGILSSVHHQIYTHQNLHSFFSLFHPPFKERSLRLRYGPSSTCLCKDLTIGFLLLLHPQLLSMQTRSTLTSPSTFLALTVTCNNLFVHLSHWIRNLMLSSTKSILLTSIRPTPNKVPGLWWWKTCWITEQKAHNLK